MQVPLDVTFKFGKGVDEASFIPDEVLTADFKKRLISLLTGKFEIDPAGRCVILPDLPAGAVPRDSVCVGMNLGPVSISYCKDIK